MSTKNKTENLKLPQYQNDDLFDMKEVNEAYKIIDESYKEQNDNYKQAIETSTINGAIDNLELIDARKGKRTLGEKISEIDSQLETNTQELVKETKKETDISIVGSNLVFKGIRKVRTSTSFGSDFFFTEGENNVIMNCDIESGSNGIIFGNESYANTPKNMKALFNKIKANSGNRARNGKDGVLNGEHDWFMNDVETVNTEVGIESWTGKSRIAFNRIINKSGNGGFGGITLGANAHQKALFNYIDGFGYGVEVGNTIRDSFVLGNTIENCNTGIALSTNGKEKTINVAYNYIKLKEGGTGISVSGAETVNITNCIIEYVSDGDYNNTSSRSGVGIEMKTNAKQVNITNCVFININDAIKGSVEYLNVTSCMFFNCNNPCYCNSYHTIYDKCYFENVRKFRHYAVSGKTFLKVSNSKIVISEDYTDVYNKYWFSGKGNSTIGLLISENNTFIGTNENPLVQNSVVGGDIRPAIFKKDNVYMTFNKANFSSVKEITDSLGIDLIIGDKIVDNYNKNSWEVCDNGKHKMRAKALPTTGVFVKGDIIYNNFSTDLTCEGWVCTNGGDFAGTPPTFKKFGIVES